MLAQHSFPYLVVTTHNMLQDTPEATMICLLDRGLAGPILHLKNQKKFIGFMGQSPY